jgi:hypothetical protein
MRGNEAGLEMLESLARKDKSKGFWGGESERELCGSCAKKVEEGREFEEGE